MKLLIPTRIGGTRWVGHLHRAIEYFVPSYHTAPWTDTKIKKNCLFIVSFTMWNIIHVHVPIIFFPNTQMTSPDTRPSNKIQVAKARCFLKLLSSRDVIQYLHLLYDVCTQLKKLSAIFQQREASACDAHRALKSAYTVIKTYLTQYVVIVVCYCKPVIHNIIVIVIIN